MVKELSKGLRGLAFMNRGKGNSMREQARSEASSALQADPMSVPSASDTLERPTTERRSGNISSKLLALKFMQKAAHKDAMVKHVKEAAKRAEEERFVLEKQSKKGCVVVEAAAPLTGLSTGRLSFMSFNPDVEKANAERSELLQRVRDDEAKRATEISNAEMAAVLGRKRGRGDEDELVTTHAVAPDARPSACPATSRQRAESHAAVADRLAVSGNDGSEGTGRGGGGGTSDPGAAGEAGADGGGPSKSPKKKARSKEGNAVGGSGETEHGQRGAVLYGGSRQAGGKSKPRLKVAGASKVSKVRKLKGKARLVK